MEIEQRSEFENKGVREQTDPYLIDLVEYISTIWQAERLTEDTFSAIIHHHKHTGIKYQKIHELKVRQSSV